MKFKSQHKTTFIRDVLYKNIDISEPVIQEIINTKEFQRLRWISQLGGAQIAFPNATHTRFTHSLGVFHLLTKILKEVAGHEDLSYHAKLTVRIAGLLHDLGHGPFSHTFEKITNLNEKSNLKWSHEYYTCQIISDKTTEIHQVLTKYQIDITQIIAIISKNPLNSFLYQRQLVSSQIDCDRIDYLIRDAYFTGVSYGTIDLEWVISNMIIDKNHGIIFQEKAIWAIENYLIARFHMYSQVYHHKSSVIFDLKLIAFFTYLKKLHEEKYRWKVNMTLWIAILEAKPMETAIYLQLTDATLISFLKDIIMYEIDPKLLKMANSIFYVKNDYQVILHHKVDIKNAKQKLILLKNSIYDTKSEIIIIKMANNTIEPLEKVSQLFTNQNYEQTIGFELIKN